MVPPGTLAVKLLTVVPLPDPWDWAPFVCQSCLMPFCDVEQTPVAFADELCVNWFVSARPCYALRIGDWHKAKGDAIALCKR